MRLSCLARLSVVVLITIITFSDRGGYFVIAAERANHTSRTDIYITSLSNPIRVGRIQPKELRESSGIIASRRYPGIYWSINDSGNPPDLFAIKVNGKGICRIRISSARNVDWEDIAIDADGKIYIGDFGNNSRRRRVLSIYCLDEPAPDVAPRVAKIKRLVRFTYPSKEIPFDCEAMFVRKGWAYLISKEFHKARFWGIRLNSKAEAHPRIRYLGSLPHIAQVTAADISPDGKWVAVLSYFKIVVYQLPRPIEKMIRIDQTTTTPSSRLTASPFESIFKKAKVVSRHIILGQAEGICWELSPKGKHPQALIITNEQRGIYRIKLHLSKKNNNK